MRTSVERPNRAFIFQRPKFIIAASPPKKNFLPLHPEYSTLTAKLYISVSLFTCDIL